MTPQRSSPISADPRRLYPWVSSEIETVTQRGQPPRMSSVIVTPTDEPTRRDRAVSQSRNSCVLINDSGGPR